MQKRKLNNVVALGLVVGGVILETKIIKKLNDIHQEIMYFESCQGYSCKAARDMRFKEEMDEIKRRRELEEA